MSRLTRKPTNSITTWTKAESNAFPAIEKATWMPNTTTAMSSIGPTFFQ